MDSSLLATVDLGSNSFRLLIAKPSVDGALYHVDQIKETVRLAGGLDENNYLNKESQLLALEVLSRFSERLIGFKHSQVRVVATSTLRVAKNANDFIVIANKTLGFNIEVISGNEEARLIYIGAMHSLAYEDNKRLVIDIGGGSTEFVIGMGYEPQIMESVTMGCVSFSNRYFSDGQLSEDNFANAIFTARGKIQVMKHLFVKHTWSSVIGTSGTAKALYELCLYNGFSENITKDGLYRLKKVMIKNKTTQNLNLSGLKDDRKGVLPGGLSIMIAVMEELDIEHVTIADGSLREGVMYDLLGRGTNFDLRGTTVNSLKKRYLLDDKQSNRVSDTALYFCKELIGINDLEQNSLKLLQWACELYEIGLSISHNDYHKHGAYILANADLAGFSKPEQSVLADLVRSHRGGLVKACQSISVNRKIKQNFFLMIMSFRFSVILTRNRKNLPTNAIISIKPVAKSSIELVVDDKWLCQNPLTLYSLNEEILQWKKIDFKIKPVDVQANAKI